MFGGSAWTRLPDGEWYLHLFAPEQPDLNWAHPDVRADAEQTLRFWVARGVDGFRVDVAGGLAKDAAYARSGGTPPSTRTGTAPTCTRSTGRGARSSTTRPPTSTPSPRPGDRRTAPPPSRGPTSSVRCSRSRRSAHPGRPPPCAAPSTSSSWRNRAVDALPAWVVGNHDIARAATRLGAERSLALHLFLLAMPGAFYLYAGDELGLPDVDVPRAAWQDPQSLRSGGRLPNRDGARIPLPWSAADPSFGFTTGTPWLPMPAVLRRPRA